MRIVSSNGFIIYTEGNTIIHKTSLQIKSRRQLVLSTGFQGSPPGTPKMRAIVVPFFRCYESFSRAIFPVDRHDSKLVT